MEQGSTLVFTDESTEENVIEQPHLIMEGISWLPNADFTNDGGSLDGFPMFESYELIWSWKDNT